jgi:hypothetical protein
MGSIYPNVFPIKGTEFTFFYLCKIKVSPSKTEMLWVTAPMSHRMSSIRILKSPPPLRRDIWSDIPPASGDLEGMAGLKMVVRSYRLFLLNHITFCGTYNDCSEETSMNRHTDNECLDNLHINYT